VLADGWASLTPLVGVREDVTDNGRRTLDEALAAVGATMTVPDPR
jgi:hypothetical protein